MLQPLPSSQSASLWQSSTGHSGVQNWFGMPHGCSAEQVFPVQRFSMVSKHPRAGVEHAEVQNSFPSRHG
jgi:hypothetical protein